MGGHAYMCVDNEHVVYTAIYGKNIIVSIFLQHSAPHVHTYIWGIVLNYKHNGGLILMFQIIYYTIHM